MAMRRTALFLVGAVLAAALAGAEGHEEAQFVVRISAPHMLSPGRLGADVIVEGLRPEPQPTIEWTVAVGGQVVRRPTHPLIAPRVPASIDLPAGRIRVGGDVSVAEFTPVPPLEENLPISVEIVVRQGDTTAVARQTVVMRLPTVIVPGYLNDIAEAADPEVMSGFERRGFSAAGPSPDLFWFTYRSRALSLRDAAAALAAYVRNVVLRAAYAARSNVVGYSLGGLIARWNIAFEPGWSRLVDRLILVATPNEGSVASYVYAWYPAGILARTRRGAGNAADVLVLASGSPVTVDDPARRPEPDARGTQRASVARICPRVRAVRPPRGRHDVRGHRPIPGHRVLVRAGRRRRAGRKRAGVACKRRRRGAGTYGAVCRRYRPGAAETPPTARRRRSQDRRHADRSNDDISIRPRPVRMPVPGPGGAACPSTS